MKIEKPKHELLEIKTISLARTKEIMGEEGIQYADKELEQILEFISKVISITTSQYERLKEKQAKIISINTNSSGDETKSIPLYPSKHRRAV